MSENSIKFSLSNSEQRDSWLNSSHWTLDADNNDMFSCLDFSFTAWAADGEVREESLSILSNGGVAGSHASETGAERVGVAYRREP